MLQLREKEIFETLKSISRFKFAVIGGYAANVYALPRFSVDCDIVVQDSSELGKIEKDLVKIGYVKHTIGINLPYHGKFLRYEKTIEKGFRASIDILFTEIVDRQTNAAFSADWIFSNSSFKILKGKTIIEELKLRIINLDALIAMKLISCRSTDIRDIFMLILQAKNIKIIKKEVSERCNIDDRFMKLKTKITSHKFKDDLQGVYGYVDEKIFNKHKNAVLEMIG